MYQIAFYHFDSEKYTIDHISLLYNIKILNYHLQLLSNLDKLINYLLFNLITYLFLYLFYLNFLSYLISILMFHLYSNLGFHFNTYNLSRLNKKVILI